MLLNFINAHGVKVNKNNCIVSNADVRCIQFKFKEL